jgi:deoxyribodipyrimidine photo-lyase
MSFEATRTAGLQRLQAFVPQAGGAYQSGRNFDLSASSRSVVSQLSPWLRHRLISETEVLDAVLHLHSPKDAMSFIQEVFWRGYFKGWLEQHPSVWSSFQNNLHQQARNIPDGYTDAIQGQTGIACFDHWSRELRSTGYLHNHARMWFASIWIFTLRLPWELGAAFFLNHLHDADPASNTLSWRWVAGLHTKGKHYLATAENIVRFTDGQFFPKGQLNEYATALDEPVEHPLVPLPFDEIPPSEKALRLITEEDCLLSLNATSETLEVLGIVSPDASGFAQGAVQHTTSQLGGQTFIGHNWSDAIAKAAERCGTRAVVTSYIPNGFVRDGLHDARRKLKAQGITLYTLRRPYDSMVWPHTAKGFFKLKKQIPQILDALFR